MSSLRLARRALCSTAALAAAAQLSSATTPTAPPPTAPTAGFDGTASRLEGMLAHNVRFVREGAYRDFEVKPSSSNSRCVILTCMDSRLTHLLPAALNIKQGEAKIVKTAGAILSHPFGGVMRSIVVAIYELRASEVFVIGHDDCGMRTVSPSATIEKMVAAGVPADRVEVLESAGVDVHGWLAGFASVDESVLTAVETVRKHPLVPPTLRVTGLVIDPTTGALRLAGAAGGAHSH